MHVKTENKKRKRLSSSKFRTLITNSKICGVADQRTFARRFPKGTAQQNTNQLEGKMENAPRFFCALPTTSPPPSAIPLHPQPTSTTHRCRAIFQMGKKIIESVGG